MPTRDHAVLLLLDLRNATEDLLEAFATDNATMPPHQVAAVKKARKALAAANRALRPA